MGCTVRRIHYFHEIWNVVKTIGDKEDNAAQERTIDFHDKKAFTLAARKQCIKRDSIEMRVSDAHGKTKNCEAVNSRKTAQPPPQEDQKSIN